MTTCLPRFSGNVCLTVPIFKLQCKTPLTRPLMDTLPSAITCDKICLPFLSLICQTTPSIVISHEMFVGQYFCSDVACWKGLIFLVCKINKIQSPSILTKVCFLNGTLFAFPTAHCKVRKKIHRNWLLDSADLWKYTTAKIKYLCENIGSWKNSMYLCPEASMDSLPLYASPDTEFKICCSIFSHDFFLQFSHIYCEIAINKVVVGYWVLMYYFEILILCKTKIAYYEMEGNYILTVIS